MSADTSDPSAPGSNLTGNAPHRDAPSAPRIRDRDMPPEEFRTWGYRFVDWIADYMGHPERYPVLARVKPGDIVSQLPPTLQPIEHDFGEILEEFERVLVPGLTHWNHPGFFAYFAISASGPGILADLLSSALNQQAMLWRTSPAATELEEVALGWLRQLLRLPDGVRGRHLRHGVGLEPARARRGARGGRARRAPARPRRAGTSPSCASTARSRHIPRSTRP